MTKADEIANPASCFNKASDNELIFVLLARDKAAPAAIAKWMDERIRRGLNKPDDMQIKSAFDWILATL